MPVGVLIPVHGFAPYLAEALDSVLAESPAQVVVIDDRSDPPLSLHSDHDGRVTLVRRDGPAGGPAAARAAGLAALASQIDLVALCDADDAWLPGSLAPRVAALADGDGMAFGRAVVVGPDGHETGERWATPRAGRHDAAAFAQELFAANPVPTSSVVLRRAALEAAGGFEGPVEVAEDWELWLRIACAGFDAVCVDSPAVRYRRHPGGLTADVARLAAAQLAVHDAHGALVDEATRARVRAADLRALAAGRARAGDPAGARAALAQLDAPAPADRVRASALALPGLRGALGRRDPYR